MGLQSRRGEVGNGWISFAGDLVLDGTSTLTLFTSTLQHLTHVFEQHLVSRNQNHGFVALPSHPADTSAILQAQFLFDVLQKTLSLKVGTKKGALWLEREEWEFGDSQGWPPVRRLVPPWHGLI